MFSLKKKIKWDVNKNHVFNVYGFFNLSDILWQTVC